MAGRNGPVGSATWISSERDAARGFVGMEVEEFAFSAQNEMDWLNEHMAEMFSKGSLDMADIFKTPGKLRGKTPRTARKPFGEDRMPLTDVFSTNSPILPPVRKLSLAREASQLANGADQTKTYRSTKHNNDSGYVGSTDGEVDKENSRRDAQDIQVVDSQQSQKSEPEISKRQSTTDRSTSEYHSAQESLDAHLSQSIEPEVIRSTPRANRTVSHAEKSNFVIAVSPTAEATSKDDELDDMAIDDQDDTPVHTVVRKSSLNFASLPAREPLNTKKSLGFASSRHTAGRSIGGLQALQDESEIDTASPTEAALHNKKSTQSLSEKINMLGQPAPPASKHVLSSVVAAQVEEIESRLQRVENPRQSEQSQQPSQQPSQFSTQLTGTTLRDEDDDWIPSKPAAIPLASRPVIERAATDFTVMNASIANKPVSMYPELGHMKTLSLSDMRAASPPAKHISTSNPIIESTTPAGSPIAKPTSETPLTAKEKLSSIFKSAKGIFANSANASEKARLAILGGSRNDLIQPPSGLTGDGRNKQLPPPPPEPRKTRSSTEKEKEKGQKLLERMDNDLDRAREQVRQQAAAAHQRKLERPVEAVQVEPRTAEEPVQQLEPAQEEMSETVEPKPAHERPSMAQQPRKLKDVKRPIRPNKDGSKPVPVAIRVGTASTIGHLDHDRKTQTLQPEPVAQSQPEKAPMKTKPVAHTLSRSASNSSMYRSASQASNRPKALLMAAREKEKAAEKEAQRKAEMEKRRQQEEERKKAEQRREAEKQQRERARLAAQEDSKNLTHKQQIEKRRLELAKKNEQLKNQLKGSKPKIAPEFGASQSGANSRGELGHNRAVPKVGNMASIRSVQDFQSAAADNRPVKRTLQAEPEGNVIRLVNHNDGPSYQQMDSKRRRTNEMDEQPQNQNRNPIRPPLANSIIRKEVAGPIRPNYPQGYAPASSHSSAAYGQSSKSSNVIVHGQGSKQPVPMDMSKYISNEKIPFADPKISSFPMPPPKSTSHHQQSYRAQSSMAPPQMPKSSPHYKDGDAISLPDIPSDSDADDSDAASVASWACSPVLTRILLNQQLVDRESIFGPIPPLHMEEIFRTKNETKQQRFRPRTSSANWSGADKLTVEEIQKDAKAREKLIRDGGWSYGNYGA